MRIIKVREQEILQNPHNAEVRKLYENENMEVMHITLQPGEHLIKHSLAVDVVFYILEGRGKFETENGIEEVEKDTLIEGPANMPRGWHNDSNEKMKILVIKSPKPTIQEKKEAITDILRNKNNN